MSDAAHPHAHGFDWTAGYPSVRQPIFARNIVSTSHPLAAQAGLRMLAAGGNAVDAAIAAAAVMTIVEPCSNGLGSDAFAIVWDGSELHGLNASGCAPAAWTPAYFHSRHGEAMPTRGWDAVTVPGAVAGWVALSERFGRLPLAEVLQPAIAVAERGYAVPVIVASKWAAAAEVQDLVKQPGFAQTFLPHGRAPHPGERFTMPGAARTLRAIAATNGAAFYEGEIAQALAAHAAAHGGAMRASDLADFRPQWVQPLQQRYRDFSVHEIPPNGQGIAALMALGIASHFDLAAMPVDGADAQHIQIEAMKLAFADVYRYVAEPAAMTVSASDLLDENYLRERARLIDLRRAQVFEAGSPTDVHRRGGTIYLAAADESGLMVSFIQSNYMGFGSGVVLPDWGLSLQNRGHAFSLDPASPNVVAPGKRPFHTIIPAFLTKPKATSLLPPSKGEGRDGGEMVEELRTGEARRRDGGEIVAKLNTSNIEPVMSFGVMGGNMQPQGHMQTLVRMLDYGQNPQAACDAPRWRFNAGLEINVEAAMNPITTQALKDRGHQVDVIQDTYQDFGAGQFIWRLGDPAVEGYVAASDSRRDGQAAAF
jgi:gamma-glutamyltranspeptidase / glutathione hydrolase